ncbi:MAG: hypothetical protein GXO80_06565 [Chlorobi bacterium]|nr:hypothetical protein [Chlorobiota bacterium]
MKYVVIIIYLAFLVFEIAALWKVFVKAGKPGWAAIVPIYNLIVLIEITGKPLWWFILFLIPFVNYIFIVWVINLVSKSFGKEVGFTLGLIFLAPIFWPILGFGKAEYKGPAAKEAQTAA